MSTKIKVLRVSMYLKRRDGLSMEEFNKYWTDVHGPLVRPLIKKHGILKYTQYHTTPQLQQSTLNAWPEAKALPLSPYDGVAEFIVTDILDIQRSREDPYFHSHIKADEEKFFDGEQMAWTIGWEEVYVENGELVPESQIKLNSPLDN